MAPQLATVDVALNAFYGIPMLSPTTRSLQNLKLRLYLKAKLIMFWKGLDANLTTQNKEFKMFTLKSLSTKYKQLI